MIKHHGWFVLSVGRRVALRPSHGHLLGKQLLMKGTWPTGVPAHTTSSSELWDPFKSTRSPHTSICAFLMSRGTGRMEALHCFHALVTQDSDHVPLHRVPGMFTDPGTDSSLSLPITIFPQFWPLPFGERHPPASCSLDFCLLYSSVPQVKETLLTHLDLSSVLQEHWIFRLLRLISYCWCFEDPDTCNWTFSHLFYKAVISTRGFNSSSLGTESYLPF